MVEEVTVKDSISDKEIAQGLQNQIDKLQEHLNRVAENVLDMRIVLEKMATEQLELDRVLLKTIQVLPKT